MKIFITFAICVYQAVIADPFEYSQIFADIKICGTNRPAYPFCAVVEESPIDLAKKGTLDADDRLHCDRDIDWDYNGHEEFEVEKKEHTIEVLVPHGVAEFDNPVDPVTSYNKVAKFCLEQVHFHWDDDNPDLGSEHAVGGKKYPLEAHFVHYNCVRGSVGGVQQFYPNQSAIDAAKLTGRDVHELAVIGVFFKIKGNKDNPAIQKILDAAELIYHKEKKECKDRDISNSTCLPDPDVKLTPEEKKKQKEIKKEREEILIVEMQGIDLGEILTDDILEGGYWTYEGSLTTPPCTPDVRWFNMKKESYISQAQWDRYTEITRPCQLDTKIAPNWRPLQDNVNPVFTCDGRRHKRRPCDGDDDDDEDDEDDDDDGEISVRVKVDVKLPSDDNGDDGDNEGGDAGDKKGNEGGDEGNNEGGDEKGDVGDNNGDNEGGDQGNNEGNNGDNNGGDNGDDRR